MREKTCINNELSDFNNHLMDGLVFCKKVYHIFEGIRKSPDGIRRLRLRRGRLEKNLIEELLPIAGFIKARYNHVRQIKVRWIDGNQSYDAELISRGFLVDMNYVPKIQTIEVTTAVHENDYISRRILHENGGTFGPKGIEKDSQTKEYISRPHVYTNYEAAEDLTDRILQRIKAKNENEYPELTTLIIQCFLDTLFFENEWEYAMTKLKDSGIVHNFYEIFIIDSNHRYSVTLYGSGGSTFIGKSANENH